MKKFYFLLVAMLVGFAANADYYLIGGFNGWSLKQANCKFSDNGDGTFVLDYNGSLTSGFKINDGTWSNDAANFGGSGNLTIGTPFNLQVGGSSGNIGLSENITNPHIVFNPTAKTLLITGQASEVVKAYDIWGDLAIDETWASTALVEKNGKWEAENVVVTCNAANFGIRVLDSASGSQMDWISADGANEISGAGTFNCKIEGTNFAIATGTYGFSFDPETMVLTVTGEGGEVEIDYTGWYLNVVGDFNEWSSDEGAEFAADGTAVKMNAAIGAGSFKCKLWTGSADVWFSTGSELALNEWIDCAGNADANMTIAGQAEGNVYNVYFDHKNLKIKVELVGGGDDPIVVEVPEALYIIGDLCAWNTAAGIELTKEGNVFTGEAIEFPATGENTLSFFNLSDKLGADWDELNAVANRYGAEKEGDELVAGTAADVVTYKNNVNASACHSWTITPGKYDVKVDFNDIENVTITLTSASSSVDAIAIDSNNAAPVYYNLQGVQVNEPAAGLYIVRRGDKVAKEIVR
ncbi:MAG: hypothetical protein K2H61_02855 [Muribaculaceae bacterium]|nr:hypothetical protein [Muribaculaceae bacterium]